MPFSDTDTSAVAEPASLRSAPTRKFLMLGCVLLFLASLQCATSIFYVNTSRINLEAYRAGTEKMPYQGRIGMMPILNLASGSPLVAKIARKIDVNLRQNHKHSRFEQITPAELASMAAAIASMLAMTAAAVFYGYRRFPLVWWLPAAFMLAMLFVTQGSRYENAYWYPYDLPHDALFGVSCLLILDGAWLPAFLLYLVDLPVRGTSLFLVAVFFAVAWARGQRKQAIAWPATMCLLWLPLHFYVAHRFAGNGTEQGIHLKDNLMLLVNPVHWPQIASALGYLMVPLVLARRRLSKVQQAFLWGAAPCILVTLAFGKWVETRIFNEWLLPAAVLLTAEIWHYFASPQVAFSVDTAQAEDRATL